MIRHVIQIRNPLNPEIVDFQLPLPPGVDEQQRQRLNDFAIAFNSATEAMKELLTAEQAAEVIPPLVVSAANLIEAVIKKYPRMDQLN